MYCTIHIYYNLLYVQYMYIPVRHQTEIFYKFEIIPMTWKIPSRGRKGSIHMRTYAVQTYRPSIACIYHTKTPIYTRKSTASDSVEFFFLCSSSFLLKQKKKCSTADIAPNLALD